MSNGPQNPLEDQIRGRFLEMIEENSDISEQVVEIVRELSDEDDFGGREQLESRVLEVKGSDED